MPETIKVYGPPGTGKTEYLLNIVDSAIQSGIKPERIAFMAFTKKAADEASARAMERFKLTKERLPWFRTLHSMAFKTTGANRDDIMQERDYKELGYELGFQFTSLDDKTMVPAGTALGDKVARIESLSRLRKVSLREQWIECNFYDVDFKSVIQWDVGLQRYKTTKGLIDYTDLLEHFNENLEVDLFILDEAQDLPALQWEVVHKAAALAKKIYMAGDDDQCIYDWAGASPELFIAHDGSTMVLPKSFRIPRVIQAAAEEVVSTITNRQMKKWESREAEGKLDRVMYEDAVDLKQGSWLLLARNHQTLYRFQTIVENQGYPYIKEGRNSIDQSLAKAILSWEQWRKGKSIKGSEVKNLSKYIPVLEGWTPKGEVIMSEAPLPEGLKENTWMNVLEILPKKREYLRSCLANKESLFTKPRITISTIHRAKGGEADHVVLISDITQNPWHQLNTDSEKRVLYVALTRAKESLTIVQPASNKHYRI